MSVGAEMMAASLTLSNTARTPIAELSPDLSNSNHHYIEATVALIWPFSSSTKRISLLLADKDVRLRKSKGQVKVTFHDDCAQEVAKTHPGIGDIVELGLGSATWTRTGEETYTPGRKLEWDIDFHKRVWFKVVRGEGLSRIINFIAASPPPTPVKISAVEIAGPTTVGHIDIRKAWLPDPRTSSTQRHQRIVSSSHVDRSRDRFADEDGYVDGIGRKRTKFARHSGTWRLLDADDHVLSEDEKTNNTKSLQQHIIEDDTPPDVGLSHDSQATVKTGQLPPVREDSQNIHSHAAVNNTVPLDARSMSPSPENQEDEVTVPDHSLPGTIQSPMLPPTTQASQSMLPSIENPEGRQRIEAPMLQPLLSPGLAIASPSIERGSMITTFFPTTADTQSMLGNISQIAAQKQSLRNLDRSRQIQTTEIPDILEQDELSTVSLLPTSMGSDALSAERNSSTAMADSSVPNPSPTVTTEHDIALASKHMHADENVIGSVDLDALQEHIENSGQQYSGPSSASQTEDEDMYGPPVKTRAKKIPLQVEEKDSHEPSVNIRTEEMNLDTANDAVRLVNTSIELPELSPSYSQGTRMFLESSDDEVEDQEASKRSIPYDEVGKSAEKLIAETLDQEQILDKQDMPNDKNERSQKVMDSYAESTTDENLSENLSHEYHSAPLISVLEAAAPSTVISSNEAISLLAGQTLQLDGAHGIYEDESQRKYLRNGETLMVTSTDHQADGMNSGEPDSSGDLAVMSEFSTIDVTGTTHKTEPERSLEVVRATKDFDYDISGMIDEQIDQELNRDDTRLPATINLTQQPSFLLERQGFWPPDMITPEATQDAGLPVPLTTEIVNERPLLFPPSPQLTQDMHAQERKTGLTELHAFDSDNEDKTEPTLPIIAQSTTSPIRRPSQRLTRKTFMSEDITSEYFTPRRSTRVAQTSPTLMRDTPSMPRLPRSPLRSKRTMRSPSPVVIQDKLTPSVEFPMSAHGTSTPLSYYPCLSMLREYFHRQVDVIAICASDSGPPSKAAAGPKDYYTTLFLVDRSLVENSRIISAQVFRPRKNVLPAAKRGDVVLLRSMNVQTHNHGMSLLSTESSAWAVFKQSSNTSINVTVDGPPVEYGDHERSEAGRLLEWWTAEGGTKFPVSTGVTDTIRGSREKKLAAPMLTRSQKRKAQAANEDEGILEDEPTATVQEGLSRTMRRNSSHFDTTEVSGNDANKKKSPSPAVPVKRQTHQRTHSKRSESVVHELRDGFKWVDDDDRQKSPGTIHQLRDGSTYVDE